MQATTTIQSAHAEIARAKQGASESLRTFQNNFLSELPGLALAVITLVYVVSALVRL
jgi:hypothetical protein